jgi:hypothetical protein
MVLRSANFEESFAGLAITGALAPRLLADSWKALESIRAISTKLPAYAASSNPGLIAQCRFNKEAGTEMMHSGIPA